MRFRSSSRGGANTATQEELKDLLNLPENANKCGECNATFPTWCSTNLGVFLCGRCASVHRKVLSEDRDDGYVSHVKSLSIDRWSSRELDEISNSGGNKRNSNVWNPKREPFPFDGDDDKSRVEEFIRDKYVLGRFRYDDVTMSDFGDTSRGHRNKSRERRDKFRYRERMGGDERRAPGKLTNRRARDFELVKYSKELRTLRDMGFDDVDNGCEALSLCRGDINGAIDMLSKNGRAKSSEPTPSLPKRRPTQRGPQPAVFDGMADLTQAPRPAIFDGTVQQYYDPQTGMIYVDQNEYAQAQLQMQTTAAAAAVAAPIQYQATMAVPPQQFPQMNMQMAGVQQYSLLQQQQQQQPLIDKNALMGLYNRPDLYTSPVEIKEDHPQYQQLMNMQQQQQLMNMQQQQQLMNMQQQQQQQQNPSQTMYPGYYMQQ